MFALSGCLRRVASFARPDPPSVPYGGFVVCSRGPARELQPFECELVVEEAGDVVHESTHVVSGVDSAPTYFATGPWTTDLHDVVARLETEHHEATFDPLEFEERLEALYEEHRKPIFVEFWLLSATTPTLLTVDPPELIGASRSDLEALAAEQ